LTENRQFRTLLEHDGGSFPDRAYVGMAAIMDDRRLSRIFGAQEQGP
jgi:hypothetical protein